MAEGHLGDELPFFGDACEFFDFVVDEGVVVLEVDAESQVGQGGPDSELHHAVGLLGPDGEVLGVERELGGHVVDDGRVVEVEDRAIGCGEGVDLGFCRGEVAGGTILRSVSMVIFQMASCVSPKAMTALPDCMLKADGTSRMTSSMVLIMVSWGIVTSLLRV